MTPEELQEMQAQIAALNESIEMIATMVGSVDAKLDAGQAQQNERDVILLRIADELAGLADELRQRVTAPKKKTRRALFASR